MSVGRFKNRITLTKTYALRRISLPKTPPGLFQILHLVIREKSIHRKITKMQQVPRTATGNFKIAEDAQHRHW